jgi:ubiquinone/menaquinone biosynthesis C-methylase UbiE
MRCRLIDKYNLLAENFSDNQYINVGGYFKSRFLACNKLGPRFVKGESVLELGCGDGEFTCLLLNYGLIVLATDYSQEMIKQTKKRLVNYDGCSVSRVDVNNINTYPDKYYDHTIALMRTFLHYSESEKHKNILEHLCSITKKRLVFDYNPRIFTESEIKNLVLSSGFSKVYIQGFFYPQTKNIPRFAAVFLDFFSKNVFFRKLIGRHKFNFIVTAIK